MAARPFTPTPKVGEGNGRFLGHIANGLPRAEIVRRWKAGEYDPLHSGLAKWAMGDRHSNTPSIANKP